MGGKVGRRKFIKRAAGTAAAALVGAAGFAGAKPVRPVALPVRTFGKTGVRLPVYGLGGAELAKAWGGNPSRQYRVDLVRHAYARGVRYFDTAGNYLESQSILGEALEDLRDKVFVNTRVETTRPGEVRRAVEKSLRELKTDHVDTIQIHGTPGLEYMSVRQAMKVHAELLKAKAEGMARFVGFSAHSYFDKALELVKTGGFDMFMPSYGYIGRGHDQLWSGRLLKMRDECIARAHELGMGIVAMKVMAAGMFGGWARYLAPGLGEERCARLPGAAIRHVFNDERVHVINIGAIMKSEVDANADIMRGDTKYTSADRKLLEDFVAAARKSDYMKKMKVDK